MRFYILFLTLMLSLSALSAQQRIRKLKNANDKFKSENYAEALNLYENLMSTSAGRGVMGVDAKINMAESYRLTDQVAKAKPLYLEVLPYTDERPDILIGYGEALLANGQYSEARSYFLQYSDKRPDDPKGPEMVKRVEDIESIVPLFMNVSINYEAAVNDSITDEFAPVYYGNGVVFVSDKIQETDITAKWGDKERSFLNLFFAEITPEGNLGPAKPFARRLNSNTRHDGPATFSRDGKVCVYSQSAKASAEAEAYTLQLFAANIEESDWNLPEVMEFVTQGHLFSHPCLSADGRTLFFMSDMPGGYGGTDIWMVNRQGDKWSKPQNLGEAVNTAKNEAFPSVHPDGTLYFASKGHAGYGGFDIFRSRPTGNGVDWTSSENLGEPFNSSFDDTYLLMADDKTRGFLSSARDGNDNIYSFELVGAEAQDLPMGILPRGGDVSNFPNAGASGGVDDEALVDSLLNSGFQIEEPVVDPTPKNPDNSDPNNANPNKVNPDNNNPEDPANPSWSENPDTTLAENPSDWNPENPNNPNPNPNSPDNFDPNWVDDGNPDDPGNPGNNLNPDNGDLPVIESDPTKANVKLVIDLKVVDKSNNRALSMATVSVRNLFTDEEQQLTLDANAKVSITLKADQKYIIRAECNGYYGSTMPVTTMQAYENQTVPAQLPLDKK